MPEAMLAGGLTDAVAVPTCDENAFTSWSGRASRIGDPNEGGKPEAYLNPPRLEPDLTLNSNALNEFPNTLYPKAFHARPSRPRDRHNPRASAGRLLKYSCCCCAESKSKFRRLFGVGPGFWSSSSRSGLRACMGCGPGAWVPRLRKKIRQSCPGQGKRSLFLLL